MTCLTYINCLRDCGSSDPIGEAAALLGTSREWCLLNRSTSVPPDAESRLLRRQNGEPLQYILSEAWFYGYRFEVSPDCLIPQPDTEHAVYHALRHLDGKCTLLDLCTGSGCIALSILKEAPHVSACAVDISAGALRVASRNAELLSVSDRIRFLEGDVLHGDFAAELVRDADVIVSNPPYINSDVIASLSAEVRHEPHIALDGGADGMDFYRRFIVDFLPLMKQDAVMILEIGYDQAERITSLCKSVHAQCRLHKDFGGNLRIAEISRNTLS